MAHVFEFLKEQPFVLLFLVIGAGFALARVRIFSIRFGVVAWTLITGLLLSLWAVRAANVSFALPPVLQTIFFNLYIFCVGLRVGPQCFAALKRNGKPFVGVAVAALAAAALLAILCGWLFHMDAGTLAGTIAGSSTASASFGAAESAAQSGAAGPNSDALSVNLSVSFAIAYSLSLAGFVVALPFLPRLTKTDARRAAKEQETELGAEKAPLPQTPEALHPAHLPVDIRAYRIEKPRTVGKSVDVLRELHPKVSIEGLRRAGRMVPIQGNLVLQLGDEVALGGRFEQQQRILQEVGPEVDVPELLELHPETADVVIIREDLVNRTPEQLLRGAGHGLFFNAAFRMGQEIPLQPQTQFERGDVVRVTGIRPHIDSLAAAAGTVVRSSSITDLLTISVGLVVGGLIGAIAVHVGTIRLSIGTVGGLLIVAIMMSWLRTRYPQLGGPIPEPARRLLEDLGLSIFIAAVGLGAGPGLLRALSSGKVLPVILTTLVLGFIPPMAAWVVGIFVLKLNPALLLGAVVGARQNSPGLQIAQDSVNSATPAMGFPVPFTIATLVFTFYGYLTMVFWPIK
jgi:putative transport protein